MQFVLCGLSHAADHLLDSIILFFNEVLDAFISAVNFNHAGHLDDGQYIGTFKHTLCHIGRLDVGWQFPRGELAGGIWFECLRTLEPDDREFAQFPVYGGDGSVLGH